MKRITNLFFKKTNQINDLKSKSYVSAQTNFN